MLKRFFPNMYINSINDIDLKILKSKNIKGFILDIDNTLVAAHVKDADENTMKWIEKAKKAGFSICIVSNATKKRVDRFTEKLGVLAIYRALKPSKKAFLKAANHMGFSANEVAVVGDQVFTDIYGGNKVGMFTMLVKPIGSKEFMFVKLKRFPERFIMSRYLKNQ